MKQFLKNLVPILAGVAIATPLFLLMWKLVGSIYARGFPHDEFHSIMIAMLFWGDLMPVTLCIALTAGMTAGSIQDEIGLSRPGRKGTLAAIVFTILVALPVYMANIKHGSPSVAHHSLTDLLQLLLAYVLLAAFSLLGAFPYIITAHVGAIVGGILRSKRSWLAVSSVSLLAFLAIGLTIIQARMVDTVYKDLYQRLPDIEAEINRHLLQTPKKGVWRIRVKQFPPKVDWINYDLGNDHISVQLSKVNLKSAHLSLMAPKGMKLDSRDSAVSYMRKSDVRESLLTNVQKEYSVWTAEKGKFSVYLSEFYERND